MNNVNDSISFYYKLMSDEKEKNVRRSGEMIVIVSTQR